MKKSYSRAIWKSLKEYPVWHPGSHVLPGDYGVLDNGCFNRIGNILDLTSEATLHQDSFKLDFLTVKSENLLEQKTSLQKLVKLILEFKRDHGVFLMAKGVEIDSLIDFHPLASILAKLENWNPSWFLVTALRKADDFALYITKGQKISFEGNAQELESFLQGDMDLSTSLKVEGDLALKQVGKNASLSVGLHRLKRRGDTFKHLQGFQGITGEHVLTPYFEEITLESPGE